MSSGVVFEKNEGYDAYPHFLECGTAPLTFKAIAKKQKHYVRRAYADMFTS